MKSLRILFSVLFVMSLVTACDDGGKKKTSTEICNDNIDNDGDGYTDCFDSECNTDPACAATQEICNNGIDDDGDGAIDCADTQCATAANCQATQENCSNGQDDDGDGAVDCADSDCEGNVACATNECTLSTLFFDSPPTCDAGFQCSVNAEYAATCVADAQFAGGTFYGDCGANGECPFGSICAGTSAEDQSCMPLCQSTTHPTCPQSGLCMYSLQGSTLNLCALPDNCDPVANTGCETAGQGCYITSQDGSTSCVPAGDGAVGSACEYLNDCAPGNLCLNDNLCHEMCDAGNTCTTGTCNTGLGLPNGWGICE